MKPVLTFRRNSYTYHLMHEGKPNYNAPESATRICLYSLRRRGREPIAFEVLIIRHNPERAIKGKVIPEGLRYPSNEDIGTGWGWSFTHYRDAQKKYKTLTDKSDVE